MELNKQQEAEMVEHITCAYMDDFFNCNFPKPAPITRKISLPKVGSHLITPRTGYTHHGIYIGNERVIHYSGLADGLSAGPVEEVSLSKFYQNKGLDVVLHPNGVFTNQEIVARARERLGETEYNLLYNNCETFVHYCIYNINTSQQSGAVLKTVAHSTLRTIGKSNPVTSIASGVTHSALHITEYMRGNISREKLLSEISHSAVVTTSSFYYAALGQVAIPIPVVGALIGSSVGYFIGNMLNRSGLIALGDSTLVKEAKERRKEIEDLCDTLIPVIKKSRKALEVQIDKYFSDRKKEFLQSFLLMDNSLNEWDPDSYVQALEKINNQFSQSLKYKTFDEFDAFMKSDEVFEF